MDDASAPVIDVATTRLLSPAFATPVAVMRFPLPLTARAPVELIWLFAFNTRTPFPVSESGPTLLAPVAKELVKVALPLAAPTLREPKPVRVLAEVRFPPSATTTDPLLAMLLAMDALICKAAPEATVTPLKPKALSLAATSVPLLVTIKGRLKAVLAPLKTRVPASATTVPFTLPETTPDNVSVLPL